MEHPFRVLVFYHHSKPQALPGADMALPFQGSPKNRQMNARVNNPKCDEETVCRKGVRGIAKRPIDSKGMTNGRDEIPLAPFDEGGNFRVTVFRSGLMPGEYSVEGTPLSKKDNKTFAVGTCGQCGQLQCPSEQLSKGLWSS
jgi:hypothetical protein